jgi:hypothetical protein
LEDINMAAQKPILKVPMPDPKLTRGEQTVFTALFAITAYGLVMAAFFPQADSLRVSASIGWATAGILVILGRNLYRNAKLMRAHLIAYTYVLKTLGMPLIGEKK